MITDTSFYCSLTKRDNLYWTVLITGRLGGGQDVGHVWWDFVGGLFCGAVERFRNLVLRLMAAGEVREDENGKVCL